MEIIITHGVRGESIAATSGGVRIWPDGNNESHKAGTLISFRKKKKDELGPNASHKLMTTLWSHFQRDSAHCMESLWNHTMSEVCFHIIPNKFFNAVRVTDMVNAMKNRAWFLVQMQMSYSCWGVALQQLHFPALKPPVSWPNINLPSVKDL